MELPGCGACGTRGPTKPASTKIFLADLDVDHWLRLTQDAKQNLKNMPTVTLVDEWGNTQDVFLGRLRSYCVTSTDAYFHVHPELLGEDEAGNEYVCLCQTCAAAARQPDARPPPQSIAAGRDFGLFSRINVAMPNETEEMALADVRTYSMVAKVHIPNVRVTSATRVLLRGHMIAFLHDAPAVLTKHFDEARVEGLLENIQLVFVGDAGNQTQLERNALRHHQSLQLRPHVLYNHLVIRQAVAGTLDDALPSIEEISKLLADWPEKLLARARFVADDAIERAAQPSDVANVRCCDGCRT
jgi:hypothetical protein